MDLPRMIGTLSVGMSCAIAYGAPIDLGVPTNISCATALELHERNSVFTYDHFAPGTDCLWFKFCVGPNEGAMSVGVYNLLAPLVSLSGVLWQASSCEGLADCTVNPGVSQWALAASGSSWVAGTYFISVPISELEDVNPFGVGLLDWNTGGCGISVEPGECSNCLGTFSPRAGHRYVMNAWVSLGELPAGTTTMAGPSGPMVQVNCPEGVLVGLWQPSGPIIDGWQRIEGVFEVPDIDPTSFHLYLKAGEASDAYFDDVRIVPEKGSMKSYVYDPENLRFVAELDERHFATIYEYDPEGKLVRVKKETERGIMTLKETRYNTSKLNQP